MSDDETEGGVVPADRTRSGSVKATVLRSPEDVSGDRVSEPDGPATPNEHAHNGTVDPTRTIRTHGRVDDGRTEPEPAGDGESKP